MSGQNDDDVRQLRQRMGEPAAEPTPSLIQQRMALDRQRNLAIIFLIVFGFNAAWWLARGTLDNGGVISWILASLFVIVVAMSVHSLLSARRKLRAFEAEHGPGAGKRS
ncbi:hypothetical protein AUC47_13970 [Microbacterium sp. SZ1]|uniref:hypothetical protein n=1 Tax=Microbacterium sp. SZ1 TaxID=1849736 RepID=UPI000BBCA899|nr:hypothetical protein [Microbacterium sp. SZ1]PCE15401.1 hypothetical protein AUC47_13970 [Microbacterium sp. SZ1]